MRTTLDLPEDLITKAMNITHAKSKTELIKIALQNIVNQEKRNNLIKYHGKIDLDINLNMLRKR
jgi:Arc/MetJ family transcription regulator